MNYPKGFLLIGGADTFAHGSVLIAYNGFSGIAG